MAALPCATCGFGLSHDSSFCPMCGGRVVPEGDATEPQAERPDLLVAPSAYPSPKPYPNPTQSPNPRPYPNPHPYAKPYPSPDPSRPLTPTPEPPGAARRLPTQRLSAVASGRPSAAAPVVIPRTPRAGRIALGGVALATAVALLVVQASPGAPPFGLPALSEAIAAALRIASLLLVGSGLALIITGALHRAHAEIVCRRCNRRVVAWKGTFGLHCPSGPHYAQVAWLTVGLTAGFWAALLGGGAMFALWLLG